VLSNSEPKKFSEAVREKNRPQEFRKKIIFFGPKVVGLVLPYYFGTHFFVVRVSARG